MSFDAGKAVPSESAESQVTILHMQSYAQRRIEQTTTDVQFASVPELHNFSVDCATPNAPKFRPTIEHKATPVPLTSTARHYLGDNTDISIQESENVCLADITDFAATPVNGNGPIWKSQFSIDSSMAETVEHEITGATPKSTRSRYLGGSVFSDERCMTPKLSRRDTFEKCARFKTQTVPEVPEVEVAPASPPRVHTSRSSAREYTVPIKTRSAISQKQPSVEDLRSRQHAAELRMQVIEESKPPVAVTPKSLLSPGQQRSSYYTSTPLRDTNATSSPLQRNSSTRSSFRVPIVLQNPPPTRTDMPQRPTVAATRAAAQKGSSAPGVSLPRASGYARHMADMFERMSMMNQTNLNRWQAPARTFVDHNQPHHGDGRSVSQKDGNESTLRHYDSVPDLNKDAYYAPHNKTKDDSFLVEEPVRRWQKHMSSSSMRKHMPGAFGDGMQAQNGSGDGHVPYNGRSGLPLSNSGSNRSLSTIQGEDSVSDATYVGSPGKGRRVPIRVESQKATTNLHRRPSTNSAFKEPIYAEINKAPTRKDFAPAINRESSYSMGARKVGEGDNTLRSRRDASFPVTVEVADLSPDAHPKYGRNIPPSAQSCSFHSMASRQTFQYEGEIDKMFNFVEDEHGMTTLDQLNNDTVEISALHPSRKQEIEVPLNNPPETDPDSKGLVHSLSAYRRLQQNKNPCEVVVNTLGTAPLTGSVHPLQRSMTLPKHNESIVVQVPIQQAVRETRPVSPTNSDYTDATPPNLFRTSELLPPLPSKPWLIAPSVARLRQEDVPISPKEKIRRKFDQFIGFIGGDRKLKEQEQEYTAGCLGRSNTPLADSHYRPRPQPMPYNVSQRGSRTPAARRTGPLATSTPIAPDAPSRFSPETPITARGLFGTPTRPNTTLTRNLNVPIRTPQFGYDGRETLLGAGGAMKGLGNDHLATSFMPKSPNTHHDELLPYGAAKTTSTIFTSTPRQTFGMTSGGRHKAAMDAWGDSTFLSTITTATSRRQPTYDTTAELRKTIQRLRSQADAQKEQIKMSEKVVELSKKRHKALNDQRDRVPAELVAGRTLLVARERLKSIQNEINSLEELLRVCPYPPPISQCARCTMQVCNIGIHLNPRFCNASQTDPSSYAFIVLLRCRGEVEATAPLTVTKYRPRAIYVHESIRFANLPPDFTISLEVYAMRLSDPKLDIDPSCINFAARARSLFSPGGVKRPPVDRTENSLPNPGQFTCCGMLTINREDAGTNGYYLEYPEWPLEGKIEFTAQVSTMPMQIDVEYAGFLTMYQMVGGTGSWERFWAVLRLGLISVWKDPRDPEEEKTAIAQLDLSKCIDEDVEVATQEITSRSHAFSIDMLVTCTPSIFERKRVIFAADTREYCDEWVAAINDTLNCIRGLGKPAEQATTDFTEELP
ncbi:unnamed protein product, partial [Mesorhabditis spiculigera]